MSHSLLFLSALLFSIIVDRQLENHKIEDLDSKQWEDCFQLNIHSYFYAAKAALKYIPKGGSIINMGKLPVNFS